MPDQLELGLTLRQVEQALQIGATSAYSLVRSGQLRSYRIGRAVRVTPAALREFVADREGRGVEAEVVAPLRRAGRR